MKAFFILTLKTIRDLLRERILYNVFFVAIFLLFLGYLAALLVFGHQDRVMMHFGTMVNAFAIYVVSASAGARILQNEIEHRTAYLWLARPISRTTFFASKWSGLILFTLLNTFLLSLVLAIGLLFTGGAFKLGLIQAMSLIWVESLVVAAFALMVAQFLRAGLTIMLTLAYFFLSHNHEQLRFVKMNMLQAITPDGQLFLLDTRAYYELPLSIVEWFQRSGYGMLWALFFLLIGNAIFCRKTL